MRARYAEVDGSQVAVVYIAFAPYGIEPFARFLKSYRAFPAGLPHELVILWKGFADAESREAYCSLIAGLPHRDFDVPSEGFDLDLTSHIALATAYDRYCFLNSNSELCAADWLSKLNDALDDDDTIVVGATGSYQSLATDMLRMVDMRSDWRALAIVKRRLLHLYLRRFYPKFPNPHLRTNGFLIRRGHFVGLHMPTLRTKEDASRFESGRRG